MSSILTQLPPHLYARDAFRNVVNDESFNLGTARALMWLSQLPYEAPASQIVDDMLRHWGLTRLGCPPVGKRAFPFLTEPNVIVAANDAAIYVAIEGTDPLNIGTVISNLNAQPSGSGTHSGFQRMADALRPGISSCVSGALQARSRPLLLAGHSLGGALAVLIAKAFADEPAPVKATAVYTFGAPRVGTRDFMLGYNSVLGGRTYRFAFGQDIVPAVPPAPYRHVGRYAYAASGRFTQTVTALPDPRSPDGCTDDPATTNSALAAVVAALQFIPNQAVSFGTTLSFLSKGLLGRTRATTSRSDLVGLLIDHLPTPIRDHIQDRYWTALQ